MTPSRILIVEDEAFARLGLSTTLIGLGHPEPACAADLAQARSLLAQGGVGLVLLDLHLPDGNGETLLEEIADQHPGLPVIVTTAVQEVQTAVRCMRAHAADYLVKPIDPLALEAAVTRTLATAALRRENRALAGLARPLALAHPEAFEELVTFDPEMLRCLQYAEIIAPEAPVVLVSGEPGTGRRTLAEALHRLSGRAGPCRHVEAATAGRDGIEATGPGTLVVDRLEELPPRAQAQLLRLIRDQDRLPTPCGSGLVAITCVDLDERMRTGELRPDLGHRLQRHRIHLPPLRDRLGDLAALVHHLAARLARRRGQPIPAISDRFIRHCQAGHWPGNIAQLDDAIATALDRGGVLDLERDGSARHATPLPQMGSQLPDPLPTMEQMRGLLIAEALRRTGGNLTEASRMLGMTRWGLSKRLKPAR